MLGAALQREDDISGLLFMVGFGDGFDDDDSHFKGLESVN